MISRALIGMMWAGLLQGQSWTQWGMNAQHNGTVRVAAQSPSRLLAEAVHDRWSQSIQAEGGGDLFAHYQPALVDGRDVFLTYKGGRYVSCQPAGSGFPAPCGFAAWDTQTWGMKQLRWVGDELRERWAVESDWKPAPNAGVLRWEPVFHGVVSDQLVAMPAAGGDVVVLRRNNGRQARRIQPFGETVDANKYVVSPLTLDDAGNLYYNVLELDAEDPWGNRRGTDVKGAWLVKVNRRGETSMVSYRELVKDAPATCRGTFGNEQLPWPPSPSAAPASVPCLSQRPGVNVAPAVAKDGTVYTVSRGHSQAGARYSYVIAVNPDLTVKWAASLRGHLRDGCGVGLPVGGAGGCRAGTAANGVDPATNELPAGQVSDLSTSSPVVTPDGGVLYGAFTTYNYLRGHLFHFSAAGEFRAAHDFGWDTTPAVFARSDGWHVVIKENNYGIGSYCFDPRFCPSRENGPYYITQLNQELKVEWRFQNTNPQECFRRADGSLSCVPAAPGGFEWCINAPAVDALGNVYANSEDGNLYVIGQGGKEVGRFFLNLALGAAYTPLSIGPDGRIYTMNDGRLFVVGE
ncbi:MAG: hypothetical protein JNK48_32205 [Bryobacterales bacterium]|nr:hypothetical protein [Bryobacterales bacterium]